MKKEEKAKRSNNRKPRQQNETVHERARRHWQDKNSVITEEDIKNVRTELTIRGESRDEQRKQE